MSNRRSYGFSTGDKKNRLEEWEKHHKQYKKNRIRKNKKGNPSSEKWWIILLLIPIKLIIYILKVFWALILLIKEKNPKISKKNKGLFKKRVLYLLLFMFVVGFLFLTILVAWTSKDLPDPDKLTDRKVSQSTKIYDRTGEHILYEVFADEKRTLVELDDIPKDLINGVIATEDTKFYEHKGVRPLSILRAVVYGIFSNKRIGGTSTLTQQLVKNAILTNERKVTRKIKEIILSIRLEQKYSKDQILKIFFNEIPYGSTNYGVESAAQSYFGKSVSDLTLDESAVLAGLPKAPSIYLSDTEKMKNRRDFVLERMYEEGYITREEADDAQAKEINIKQNFQNIHAPHFVLYVKKQLVEMFGEQAVDTGGLKVITTLDWDKQLFAEEAIEENLKNLEDANANNTSLVAMDPKSGQVLAMVGSKDFFDDEISGQFNVATLGKRQPGSSFKPIIYTAAFEKGYTPETVLFDVKTNFAVSGKDYTPLNYDLQERGPVTMKQALQGSLNIPAVKTLYLVGAEKGVEFAEKMGYSTLSQGNFGLSLVLGGGEVTLLEHTSAYGVFANKGIKNETVSILKVQDPQEDILYEWKEKRGEKVLDENIANTINGVLSDDEARSYAFGAGGILTLGDRPVAAKTGTTNGYVDAWTVGYTPSLVAGVWAGNTDNSPMKRGFGGSRVASPIWNSFMKKALANTEIEQFTKPEPEDIEKPILKGSQNGGVTLKIDKVTGKIATSSTPEKYITERTYIPAHSILHYVKKDDPRGDPPKNPTDDPQYIVWEDAIKDWIRRKEEENPDWKISFEEPPTEYDDEHSLELIPSLEIVYPGEGAILKSRQIDTDIRVSAPRGITKVSYKIDSRYISVEKKHPFNLNYYAEWLENGSHVLTISAEDDLGNLVEKQVSFVLLAEEEPPRIDWVGGEEKIKQSDFPRTFMLKHFKLDKIDELKIYQKKDNEKILLETITDFSNLFNNQIIFKWNETPAKGDYSLIAETKTSSATKKILVE